MRDFDHFDAYGRGKYPRLREYTIKTLKIKIESVSNDISQLLRKTFTQKWLEFRIWIGPNILRWLMPKI